MKPNTELSTQEKILEIKKLMEEVIVEITEKSNISVTHNKVFGNAFGRILLNTLAPYRNFLNGIDNTTFRLNQFDKFKNNNEFGHLK